MGAVVPPTSVPAARSSLNAHGGSSTTLSGGAVPRAMISAPPHRVQRRCATARRQTNARTVSAKGKMAPAFLTATRLSAQTKRFSTWARLGTHTAANAIQSALVGAPGPPPLHAANAATTKASAVPACRIARWDLLSPNSSQTSLMPF